MPLHQYAYFALQSHETPASEMAAFLGVEPDEVRIRGSRFTEPRVVPATHAWKLLCKEPNLCVDELIGRVVARLAPHVERIAALTERLNAEREGGGNSAVMQVVRYFNDDPDYEVPPWRTGDPEEVNIFGWHLDRTTLAFLTATSAVLDVDEHDLSPDAP